MFKRVVVITKDGLEGNTAVQAFLSDLAELLMCNAVMLYVNKLPEQTKLRTLFVAIGGDGTMLVAAKQSALFGAPVIGFNMGRLGFLVDNEFVYDTSKKEDDNFLSRLSNLIFNRTINWGEQHSDGNLPYIIEDRMMIEGEVSGERIGPALNEILLSPNTLAAPFEYDIFINDKFVAHHNSSGILVSTPTGSTAFSLSLGGSIMLPTATMMQVVPVAAHTLTARPVIVDRKDSIRIDVAPTTRISSVDVIVDGRVIKTLPTSSPISLSVVKTEQMVKIVRQSSWNFFDVLTQKLKWN